MRFNTQPTTTISPMIPRTNQTVRLIPTASSYTYTRSRVWCSYVWWFPTSRFCSMNLLADGGRW